MIAEANAIHEAVKDSCNVCPKQAPPKGGSKNSFSGDTLIETRNGLQRIDAIAPGIEVATVDEFTGEKKWRPVLELFKSAQPETMLQVTLEGRDAKREVLKATAGHPLFVRGQGWVKVGALKTGDEIFSLKGSAKVTSIEADPTPKLAYNFEVQQHHNYQVGELGAEAHNGPPSWFWPSVLNDPNAPSHVKGWIRNELRRTKGKGYIRNPPGYQCGHHPSNRGPHGGSSRPELGADNMGRPGITGRNPKWR